MTSDDKPEFLRILNGLAAIKPGAKLTAEGLSMYWLALEDWTLDEFKQAAKHLAKSSEFMPNPYHFEQLRKASETTAAEAWAAVLAVVRSGDYRIGKSLGGRIDAVVRAVGGYDAIGMSPTDKTQFIERRFAEAWEQIGEAQEVRKALPSLTQFALPDGVRPIRAFLPAGQIKQ
jgi:hypothetical protein